MPRLFAGDLVRDIDVVVLDKDGTLLDFDVAWRRRLAHSIRAVAEAARSDDARLIAALHRALGSAGENGAFLPDGPYLSARLADKAVIVATVLYQFGIDWQRARSLAHSRFLPILSEPPQAHEIRGIGDVSARLRLFRASGAGIAIATNDGRDATVAALGYLGIVDLIDLLVCGGDAGIASKPAPDGLLHIARSLAVPPRRLAMIGDAIGDMMAASSAGAGLKVGVLSGPSGIAQLRDHADVVVPDLHALTMRC